MILKTKWYYTWGFFFISIIVLAIGYAFLAFYFFPIFANSVWALVLAGVIGFIYGLIWGICKSRYENKKESYRTCTCFGESVSQDMKIKRR